MATEKTKKKFTFPTAFTILFLLLILIAAATWIVPAGSYDYDEEGAPFPAATILSILILRSCSAAL